MFQIVKSHGSSIKTKSSSWKESYQFFRAHCATAIIMTPDPRQTYISAIYAYNGEDRTVGLLTKWLLVVTAAFICV